MRALVIAVVMLACSREEPRRTAAPRAVAARPPATATRVATRPPATAALEPRPVEDPRATTRKAAHDALAEHCGSCHERHLPTAKPAALAIFDLDQPDWPARFDDHRFAAALGRLASKPAAARAAFTAFRDAELAAR